MLDFIDDMMYKLEQEKHYNYYSSAFATVEEKLKNIKVVKSLQKLVFSYPFDESLVDYIEFEKNNFSGKSKLSQKKLDHYYYNCNYECIIFQLCLEDRWAVVSDLTRRTSKNLCSKIAKGVLDFKALDLEMKNMDAKINAKLMKRLDIVAMTTTGACKYRQLLRKVKTKIVLVEEAAEVLEAQIVTSLSHHTEQLILIGDHQQLRPKVNSYELSEDFGLSVSLFERLVSQGIDHVVLNTQRRMRPEISRIIKLIYNDLQDHSSVKNFPSIRYWFCFSNFQGTLL